MSRTVSRGTCSVRPGNTALRLELYPLYHAFVSNANLQSVMMEVAHEHPEMARFDPQMMLGLAEEVYGMSCEAQAAEGRIRKDSSAMVTELKKLNELYKWPLLQKTAADWAPMVRSFFFDKEGQLLGDRPLYGTMQDDDLIKSRLSIATDQQRCPTAEIPLLGWPMQGPAPGPPTFAAPMPLRPEPNMGVRGRAPGAVWAPERLVPGQIGTQLCSNRR